MNITYLPSPETVSITTLPLPPIVKEHVQGAYIHHTNYNHLPTPR